MASQNIERMIEAARQLPPEERTQLREALEREEQERREAVPSSAATLPAPATNGDMLETKRRQRVEWLKLHEAEYAGKYVALDGDQLLGVGATYPQAAQAAQAAGVQRAYIDYVPVPGSVGFGGW